MVGKLVFVATAGMIGAVTFLTLGVALSGRNWDDTSSLWGAMQSTCQPAASPHQQVTLPVITSDSLVIDLPASVLYQPGETAEAIVTGDPALVDHVRIEGGRLSLDCDPGWLPTRLDVRLSGPTITDWKVLGSGDLALRQIHQSQLRVIVRGSGRVDASGAVDTVGLDISGSATARLKNLVAQSAQIRVRGSGDVEMTAMVDADVSVSGSGTVALSGHPVVRSSEIRGRGRIVQLP